MQQSTFTLKEKLQDVRNMAGGRERDLMISNLEKKIAKKEKSYKFWDDVFKPKKVETDTK